MTKHRGGPPKKTPGGLTEVLFVRADTTLIEALDARLAAERKRHPGRSISRADYVRELLHRTLAAQLHERLCTTQGRPGDPSRTLKRLVRFAPAHWAQLEKLAIAWSTTTRKVSPAQIAALLIERGLDNLSGNP